MVDLFQERYRDLPIFQRFVELIETHNDSGQWSIEELVIRLLMAAENGLNWDTLCGNCGVLMDDNYSQYAEIARLSEKNLSLKRELDELKTAMAKTGTGLALCKDCGRLALIKYRHNC